MRTIDPAWFGDEEGTLPIGAPFRPGLDPLPARQHAWAVVKDRSGARSTASRARRCTA